MSRIGKKPIPVPDTVTTTVEDSAIRVKGPKGELTVPVHPNATIRSDTETKSLIVEMKDPAEQEQRALWGLTRQLVANAIQGVQTPFEKSLEFVGVGYKVAVSGNDVKMDVGYSHSVPYALPAGIEAKVEKNTLTISGIDKQLVGEVSAQIRRIRPPEPYKGKGIKYTTEVIRRKAGKAALKGA